MSDDTLRQGTAHDARNWAIWRAHRVDGANRHDIARDVGLHPSRVWMLIREYDELARKAVSRAIDLPVSDAVRDGLLGVEFVFTHEVRLDADDDTWSWVSPAPERVDEWRDGKHIVTKKRRGYAVDEYVVYRVAQETDEA